ncbi:MAG: alpha/beta hydrolase, partial [Proteobacteria bacterium]|nr:alpha/beta hydrolase [Pseudomonadota bacterium]
MSKWVGWLGAAALALFLAMPGIGSAKAQSVIEKVANQSLSGSAYARLRHQTPASCEKRCLDDSQCVAFEFYRGHNPLRVSNCALFSSFKSAREASESDVGYKRTATARPTPRRLPSPAARIERSETRKAEEIAPPPAPAPSASPPPVAVAPAPEAPAKPMTRSMRPTVGATRGLAASDKAADQAPSAAYHTVPVFYGTDRNHLDGKDRFRYGNDRARRLEIGRAMISVPLEHKVPNIELPRSLTIPYIGTFQLEKEDPKKHFTVREIKTLSKSELLALVKERLGASSEFKGQSIVFIHGYNTTFDNALYRSAQIAYDLKFDGAMFTYSWPSAGAPEQYVYDMNSAEQAEAYLYEFLEMVQNETGTTSISIIAHSMGNQMLLRVLRSLKSRSPRVAKINQIILASPDVDRNVFETLANEINGIARGITLYAAANDKALLASRIVAGDKPRAGDVPPEGPVIVKGVDTIDITKVSTDYLALHHSG